MKSIPTSISHTQGHVALLATSQTLRHTFRPIRGRRIAYPKSHYFPPFFFSEVHATLLTPSLLSSILPLVKALLLRGGAFPAPRWRLTWTNGCDRKGGCGGEGLFSGFGRHRKRFAGTPLCSAATSEIRKLLTMRMSKSAVNGATQARKSGFWVLYAARNRFARSRPSML